MIGKESPMPDNHHTPESVPAKASVDVGSYLSGFADGEGCFSISFSKSQRHKFGWEIRPSFSVSQNGDRAEVLRIFQERLQCGSIRPDRSDKTLKFETRCISDLAEQVNNGKRKFPREQIKL